MGISTSTGIFSGIDTGSLIQQLIALESRPRDLAAQRVVTLSTQQAAFLSLNAGMNALENVANGFRTSGVFESATATSSNNEVLTATANNAALPGNLSLIVDRLVSTQQQLSSGFIDRDQTPVGATSFTFESAQARLDQDVALADLNGGSGVRRGEINLTVDGVTTKVDLSRTSSVGEVVDALNDAGTSIVASVVDGSIVLDGTGSENYSVSDVQGGFTAADLGLNGKSATGGGRVSGDSVFFATAETSLAQLNDGAGVDRSDSAGSGAFDFSFSIDTGSGPQTVNINLGEIVVSSDDGNGGTTTTVQQEAAQDLGDVIAIVNTSLTDAGFSDVSVGLSADGTGLDISNASGYSVEINDRTSGGITTTTATDLGLATASTTSTTISGSRIFGGLNTVLLSSLNGGSGLSGDGQLQVTDRSGTSKTIDVSAASTLSAVVDLINQDSDLSITASINSRGTGLLLTDTSGSTSSNLIVVGTNGSDTAASLGISTGTSGVASNQVDGSDLEKRYVTRLTQLSSLNSGSGVGTGTFVITDASGVSESITIGSGVTTIGGIIDAINDAELEVIARLNDTGDGIIVEDDGSGGSGAITIEDSSGTVATNLNLAGTSTASGSGAFLDGSQEVTIEFDATDTLDDIVEKINAPGRFASATVLNTGNGAAPFRLSLNARDPGSEGEFLIDTNGFNLGLTTLSEGRDARVFFGSSNPADGLVLTSSTNSLSGVLPGVSIDLLTASDEVVELTVARDIDAIVGEVGGLFDAVNRVLDDIDVQTAFDADTGARGALLGDSTLLSLQRELVRSVQGEPQNISGQFQSLLDVGVSIGDGGRVEFDEEKFRSAYAQDPGAVERLIATYELQDPDEAAEDDAEENGLPEGVTVTGGFDDDPSFDALGFAGIFEELGRRYTDSIDGVITRRLDTIESQIDLQNDRIEALNQQLAAREQQLASEFLAMERAIGQLQNQQASLSQISFIG
ncbi:MAG: flagellar filament capping protein FliD [Planctomycetota bacterium]